MKESLGKKKSCLRFFMMIKLLCISGPSQPDEDDYGYVSQEASAFYNRLMNKYKNLPPEKPLFSDSGKRVVKDIASTKDRVKQALKQQEIEESLPHRRKRKSTSTTTSTTTTGKEDNNREINEKETKSNEKEEKPKPKKRLPPPMDFVTLLKIAEKKQHEPIIIETKPKPEEKERLMTKKELIEHQKEKDKSEKREQRERDRNSDYAKSLNSSSVCNGSSKLAKALTGKLTKPSSITSKTVNSPVDKKLPKPINQVPKRNGEKLPDKSIKFDEKEAILLERKKVEAERRQLEAMKREIEEEKRKLEMIKRKKNDESRSSSSSSSLLGKKIVKSNERIDKSANFNGKTNVKPRQFPPADVRPRQFPPADLKSRPLKSMKNGKPGNKKRIYDDSDEEYDSELDDFIDDGPQEQSEDYSKHISEIFGYDKSKYRNFDDDDDNMESNYAQQLREEFVSTKLGKLFLKFRIQYVCE